MIKKRKNKNIAYALGLLMFLVIGVGGWSLYNLINQSVSDGLNIFGIKNFYLQNIIIIVLVIIVLVFSGHSLKKSINKLIK